MRGERYQNLIATLLIVLALASVSLVVNLSGLWWLWAPLLASLATLAAVFLREVEVPVGGRSPAEVSQALAAVLGTSAMARAPGGSCDGPAQRARCDSLPDPRDGSRHGPVLPSLDDPSGLGPPRRPRPLPRRERRCVGGRTRARRARVEVRQVRRGLARPPVAGGLARTRKGRGACVARGRPVDDPPHGP